MRDVLFFTQGGAPKRRAALRLHQQTVSPLEIEPFSLMRFTIYRVFSSISLFLIELHHGVVISGSHMLSLQECDMTLYYM